MVRLTRESGDDLCCNGGPIQLGNLRQLRCFRTLSGAGGIAGGFCPYCFTRGALSLASSIMRAAKGRHRPAMGRRERPLWGSLVSQLRTLSTGRWRGPLPSQYRAAALVCEGANGPRGCEWPQGSGARLQGQLSGSSSLSSGGGGGYSRVRLLGRVRTISSRSRPTRPRPPPVPWHRSPAGPPTWPCCARRWCGGYLSGRDPLRPSG